MSEDKKPTETLAEPNETRHQSIINRMMKKTNDKIGEYIAKRDMDPSLWIQDIANTAGILAIVYGIHSLTNETPTNPAFHDILNAVSGKPEIVVSADLTKRALNINSKINTAANSHNLVDNFYLAKVYVSDFLNHANINKSKP